MATTEDLVFLANAVRVGPMQSTADTRRMSRCLEWLADQIEDQAKDAQAQAMIAAQAAAESDANTTLPDEELS